MRILLLNQFFHPDLSPTSVLLSDVATELLQAGHQVSVVCGGASYAHGLEPALNGIRIKRLYVPFFSRGASVGKVFGYVIFIAGALYHTLTSRRFDTTLCLTTPPMLACVGLLSKMLHASKLVIWEMDVYPDVAVQLGIMASENVETRVIARIARFVRSHADAVIALGPCMRDRIARSGVPMRLLHVAENWSDGSRITATPVPERKMRLAVLYSGNLGLAHDTHTVLECMWQLHSNTSIHFIFAGGGALRAQLEQDCQGLSNVTFTGYTSAAEFSGSLAAADIGLVTMKPQALGTVVPSKLYAFLAAGRPVLFLGPAESTACRVIQSYSCGWHVQPGDGAGLSQLLRHLSENRGELVNAGNNARRAFEAEYDRPAGVSRICRIIHQLSFHN
jgi:colanic acid biosynthesis glycosyl transferase WcaI